jgi:hypothetical protein
MAVKYRIKYLPLDNTYMVEKKSHFGILWQYADNFRSLEDAQRYCELATQPMTDHGEYTAKW